MSYVGYVLKIPSYFMEQTFFFLPDSANSTFFSKTSFHRNFFSRTSLFQEDREKVEPVLSMQHIFFSYQFLFGLVGKNEEMAVAIKATLSL